MSTIVEHALKARTMADIEALEDLLRQAGATKIRYLGDREANYSALSSSADPKMLIFERLTNAFDALLELEVKRQKPELPELLSPRVAAQRLYHMPKDDLNPSGTNERAVAKLIRMEFLDSDDSGRRPTIAIRDYGIGVSNREAPYTILSLEESNKLKKPYTHGVFGKGGSLACTFSEATVLVMRKHLDLLEPGERDLVTVAIVKEIDLPDYGLPIFRYLVVPTREDSRGLPFACAAKDVDFEPGVYVAHINYRAEHMGIQTWQREESAYAYAETLLFRPTLPYTLRDSRSPPANRRPTGKEETVLSGLGRRLDRTVTSAKLAVEESDQVPSVTAYSRVARLRVQGVGTVHLRWHRFASREKRSGYVAKGNVLVFTHDGQVHHAWDQQRFATMVPGRSRVAASIFVEVDTDEVPRKICRRIFTSFRNDLRRVPESQTLEETVAAWLAHDPDLKDIEERLAKEALAASVQKMSKQFLDRLNRAIAAKTNLLDSGIGRIGAGAPTPPPRPVPELHPEPTSFTAPESISVVAGEQRVFYAQVNAFDGFVPERGTVEIEKGPRDAQLALSVGDLRRGRLQLQIDAQASKTPAEHRVLLVLTWLRKSGGIGRLQWPLKVSVLTERPVTERKDERAKGAKGAGHSRSFIALIWSKNADQQERGWTEMTAGDLQRVSGRVLAERYPEQYNELKDECAEISTVVLNETFAPWRRYLHGVSQSSDAAVRARRERYALAVGVAIAQLWGKEEQLRKKHAEYEAHPNGGEEPTKPMDEGQMRRALSETALGILAVLPEFDHLVIELREPVVAQA
jgi:hypothetical protein